LLCALFDDRSQRNWTLIVHPTKQRLRFTQPRLVHDFMSTCIYANIAKKMRSRLMNPTSPNEITLEEALPQEACQKSGAFNTIFCFFEKMRMIFLRVELFYQVARALFQKVKPPKEISTAISQGSSQEISNKNFSHQPLCLLEQAQCIVIVDLNQAKASLLFLC